MATGIIILAAGASTRLGMPKQTLVYNGKTLLEHAVDAALEVAKPVIVVLGAKADTIVTYLKSKPVTIVYNDSWPQGMASSIAAGLQAVLTDNKAINEVIIMLCDQPFVDALLLNQLIARHTESGKGIIACKYAATIGVPVLLNKKYFDELKLLQGEEGAKKLLLKYKDDVAFVSFEKGVIDIDTMNDYERLNTLSGEL